MVLSERASFSAIRAAKRSDTGPWGWLMATPESTDHAR